MENISNRIQKQYFRAEKEYHGYNNREVNKRFIDAIDGMVGDLVGDYVESGAHLAALLEDLDEPGSDAHQEWLGGVARAIENAAEATAKHGY